MTPEAAAYAARLGQASSATGRAGWRDRLAQAVRFEAALDVVRDGDEVLDLGCGPGALAGYLGARRHGCRYVGVDADPRAVDEARKQGPAVGQLVCGDLFETRLEPADVVVAVGTLVDGAALRSDGVRLTRLRRLAERAWSLARRAAVLVVLKQEVVEARPALAAEAALGGMRAEERGHLATRLGCSVEVREDVLTTDRAVLLAAEGSEIQFSTGSLPERVLRGPWGAGASALDRASLWLRVGDAARGLSALEAAPEDERQSARGRWLRDALALL